MHNLFTEFGLFLWAVAQQYVTIAAGCVVTVVIDFIAKHVFKRPLSYRAELNIVLCFVFSACFLAWRQQYEATKPSPNQPIQVNMPQQNPPQVSVSIPPAVVNFPPQQAYFGMEGIPQLASYSFGQYVLLNTNCKNFSSSVPAEDALCQLKSYFVEMKLNSQNQAIVPISEQERVWSLFEKDRPLDTPLITVAPGEETLGTVSPGILDRSIDSDLRGATKTILFAARYTWRDGGGVHTDQSCRWLQLGPSSGSDIFAGPGILKPTITTTWNTCNRHNGIKR